MAVTPPPPLSSESKKNTKQRQRQKKTVKHQAPDSDRRDPMKWDGPLPDDDPFVLLAGSTEGGFLSLEEIDDSEYGFIGGIQDPEGVEKNPFSAVSKSKKRRRPAGDGASGYDESCAVQADGSEKKGKRKQKRKSREKKRKKKKLESKECGEKKGEPVEAHAEENLHCSDPLICPVWADPPNSNDDEDDTTEELLLDEDEVYSWKELRLHPLLIKSIRRLGFKEPTPVQKAFIPAAAHQGKDVIGAAETGSGKTLAFGLPILQRLLEEKEKATRLLEKEVIGVEEGLGGSSLRALIVTPTRELALQVSDHLKEAAKFTDFRVVPIVGGMSTEKQRRLLKRRPEIIVGTPGRLWEIMSGGEQHLVELHLLSFFVLDEADRMIEHGHFHELQSIIDMLPTTNGFTKQSSQTTQMCKTLPTLQLKKRQTFVLSATIALSDNFRRKLKRGSSTSKSTMTAGLSSIEELSERAGMRADAAIVDLTNTLIVSDKLEESFIECSEEDKEAYLYYILSVHGQGRTMVFCTSIAALRRVSSILRILGIHAWTLHAQMQQRARLKAIDRFRENKDAVLVATDVAARGLDIPGTRTVVHYQLPHSAEVYIHRSGRTARASADGCCIALISPSDKTKFFALCNSLSKETLRQFPLDDAYMPEVMKRLSLARQIDTIMRKNSQENAKKSWFDRNAESAELAVEDSGSEEEAVEGHKKKKNSCLHLKKLQQDLNDQLAQPLQPKTFSHRFLAGAGISHLLQQQLEQLSKRKSVDETGSKENKRAKLLVIGQDCVEPLEALRNSGREVCVTAESRKEVRKLAETLKRQRREGKKRGREQRRKQRKGGMKQ